MLRRLLRIRRLMSLFALVILATAASCDDGDIDAEETLPSVCIPKWDDHISDTVELFNFVDDERSRKEVREAQRQWAEHVGMEVEHQNTIGMTLKFIPPGEYLRGTDRAVEEMIEWFPEATTRWIAGELKWERPRHEVQLSYGFYMASTPVTQEQYREVMGENPSKFEGDNRPVERVTMDEAVAFCERLTQRERDAGRIDHDAVYRLPTEAEWEYACRAGTHTAFYSGDGADDLAKAGWYWENSEEQTREVGRKEPNAFGLYDMHGNVGEACLENLGLYNDEKKVNPVGPRVQHGRFVYRGGSWYHAAFTSRAAWRGSRFGGVRHPWVGFRVVLVQPCNC